MEGDHEINLKEYCRCCAKKMTESMKKRRRSKGSLKIKPSVQKFIFGEDKEGIDPEFLCRTCVRLLEKVNHEFKVQINTCYDSYLFWASNSSVT